jgi:hypothetical protein
LAQDRRDFMAMRRIVRAGETEREFTREGGDVDWFDEGKDTLDRPCDAAFPTGFTEPPAPRGRNT